MQKAEIDRKFDEIVAFAEVERFVDTPVKHYSSGMYLRLAFAVAAHLEPEILIVDEVLAVGDANFQKKCLNKMEDVGHGGRTVLFVSHNMPAVARLCQRVILLDRGGVCRTVPAAQVVSAYLTQGLGTTGSREFEKPSCTRPGRGRGPACRAAADEQGKSPTYSTSVGAIDVEMEYEVWKPGYVLTPYFLLDNEDGITVFSELRVGPGVAARAAACRTLREHGADSGEPSLRRHDDRLGRPLHRAHAAVLRRGCRGLSGRGHYGRRLGPGRRRMAHRGRRPTPAALEDGASRRLRAPRAARATTVARSVPADGLEALRRPARQRHHSHLSAAARCSALPFRASSTRRSRTSRSSSWTTIRATTPRSVVRAFEDPRIRYIAHQTNWRVGAARNTGVLNSIGDFIAFLDDDDEWLPEKLERQLEIFDRFAPRDRRRVHGLSR